MKEIKLSQNKVAIVDDDDYEKLKNYKWYYHSGNRCGYARRFVFINKKYITIYMHREILETPSGFETDHINGNKLDNRKSNLRICTTKENQHNQYRHRNAKPTPKG